MSENFKSAISHNFVNLKHLFKTYVDGMLYAFKNIEEKKQYAYLLIREAMYVTCALLAVPIFNSQQADMKGDV